MNTILQIQGLDCAHCAEELQSLLLKIDGIEEAKVAFVTQKIQLTYTSEESLQRAKEQINNFENVRIVEDDFVQETRAENTFNQDTVPSFLQNKHKKQWLRILVSLSFFVIGVLFEYLLKNKAGIVLYAVSYTIAYFAVAYPVLWATGKHIEKGRIFDENFLMTIASLGAVALGEYGEAVLVMLLYQVGETLQSMAVEHSRKSITDLMQLKSETAVVFHGETQEEVSPESLQIGDIVLVKAGEKVPVDGVLIDAHATLDVKSLTGETAYSEKDTGDTLLSGSVNAGNPFVMRVTHLYKDSAVKKILDLVENASSVKAKPERFITKFARFYTPIVCICAVLVAFGVPLLSGLIIDKTFYLRNFARWAQSALTFLVVSCPCALIISIPLTYFAGIGACAKEGIIVKGASHLETLASAKIIAFDKTGTLTEGNFSILETHVNEGVDETQMLQWAAAVEKTSAHPIAKAFANVDTPYQANDVQERAGRGLIADIDGEEVLVGTAELLRERGVSFKRARGAYTLLYVAKNKRWLGVVEVGDKLRDEAKETLTLLKSQGELRLVMLTGDNEERAYKVSNRIGIDDVYAELLPDAKWRLVEELKEKGKVVYVGDGINDAPVMSACDCAVSMGKIGSAAAVEASDLVLIKDDLYGLPHSISIAKKTKAIVLQNIVFSIVMKVAFMTLGACGVLPLWLAVFGDVGVMVLAVCNSLRVRHGKKERNKRA